MGNPGQATLAADKIRGLAGLLRSDIAEFVPLAGDPTAYQNRTSP
jgi:hypothetical protein